MIVPVQRRLCLLHFRFDISFKYLASILSCCCVPYSFCCIFNCCVFIWLTDLHIHFLSHIFFSFHIKKNHDHMKIFSFSGICGKLVGKSMVLLLSILYSHFYSFSFFFLDPMLHLSERSIRK
jgi:hypothetical protein